MWSFYKEKKLLISLIAIIFDGIIIYFVPSFINKLNYFYPMLTISLIPFLCQNKKTNYFLVFILGIIYDLLYSSIFLYNALFFLGLAIIDYQIMKYFSNSLFLFIIIALLNIILYDSITFLLVIFSNYQGVTINDLFYKIKHSLILNIVSVFVYSFLFKKRRLST